MCACSVIQAVAWSVRNHASGHTRRSGASCLSTLCWDALTAHPSSTRQQVPAATTPPRQPRPAVPLEGVRQEQPLRKAWRRGAGTPGLDTWLWPVGHWCLFRGARLLVHSLDDRAAALSNSSVIFGDYRTGTSSRCVATRTGTGSPALEVATRSPLHSSWTC